MPSSFNPAVWYWATPENGGHVFSTASPGYVVTSDATYLAWVAAGNAARSMHDGELVDYLVTVGLNAAALAVVPTEWGSIGRLQAALDAFAAGCVLTSTGTAGLDGTYECAGAYWTAMQELNNYLVANSAFPNAAGSFVWPARSGNVTFDSVAHAKAVIQGLMDYRFSWIVWVQAGGSAPTWGAITVA